MRVAVAQIVVERRRGSVTLQRALTALDAVAERDPSPDIIVLPAFGGVLEHMAGDPGAGVPAEGRWASACGYHARQWGLAVAFGMLGMHEGRTRPCGVLLDMDGDVVLHRIEGFPDSSLTGAGSRSSIAQEPAAPGPTVRRLVQTRIGLLCGRDWLSSAAWGACAEAGAQVVVGPACWTESAGSGASAADSVPAEVAGFSRRFGIAAAMADCTTGESTAEPRCAGRSLILDSAGNVMRRATAWTAETIVASLSFAPARDGARGGAA